MQIVAATDHAPRFYQLILQEDMLGGWTLIREWGIQGSRGRSQREEFSARDQAEAALLIRRDEQLQRGYQVVFVSGEERQLDV